MILYYKIKHLYGFKDKDISSDGVVKSDVGEKKDLVYKLTDEQIGAIYSNLDVLSSALGIDAIDFLPFVIRDVIPFGMAKIDSRGFSLFASYILDSVVTGDKVNVNGQEIAKNHLRNSFVHGRWFDYNFGLNPNIVLFDYEHGDDNILKGSVGCEYRREELYEDLKKYISCDVVDLSLSFTSVGESQGHFISCRVDGKTYFCNMSMVDIGVPKFVIFSEDDGQILLANEDERKIFCDRLGAADDSFLNEEYVDVLNNLRDTSKKAYDKFLECDEENFYQAMQPESKALAMATVFAKVEDKTMVTESLDHGVVI